MSKKVNKISFANPEMDASKRTFLSANDKKFKSMMDFLRFQIEKDKNSEFKYCSDCHIIAETRSGSEHHKHCKNVFTSKQIKGICIFASF